MTNKAVSDSFGVERTVVVSVLLREDDEDEYEASLAELCRLVATAGGEVCGRLTQNRERPDARSVIGSGKLTELSELCKSCEATLVVFDCELTPSQIKNIEDELSEVRVIDRSMLILDIFALHAVSAEGKLQVELAQLKYTSPRLIGKGGQLSRQQGGNIAMRGPGESKLESDRRYIRRRIAALEGKLADLERGRSVQRKARERSGIKKVAIAGYTNAGKSTLLNRITGAGILAEDKLFATLDPTVRRYRLPDGKEILLSDTVGFIRNLPTHLVEAFKSTLDEIRYADVVMILSDASDKNCESQLEVAERLIDDIGASGKSVLYVFNKCDIPTARETIPTKPGAPVSDCIYISAATGEGMDKLSARLAELV